MSITQLPKRPDCFEFAMDLLGNPEQRAVRDYVERLEAVLTSIEDERGRPAQAVMTEHDGLVAGGMGALSAVTEILDGRDTGEGHCYEPWAAVRRRLIELVGLRTTLSQIHFVTTQCKRNAYAWKRIAALAKHQGGK